jgi:hypothetical protein
MSTAAPTMTPPLPQTQSAHDAPVKLYGIIAEFDTVDGVMHATRAMREHGYEKMDVHSPFPIHGIDSVLGIKPTILPWIVLAMGLTGMTTGLVLTSYTMGFIQSPLPGVPVSLEPYAFLISGKPYWSLAAYIPVIFELTIMFSAYTAVFSMFLLNKLPLLSHPLFSSKNFRRATSDRFFLAVESTDAKFDRNRTQSQLKEHDALSVELIHE